MSLQLNDLLKIIEVLPRGPMNPFKTAATIADKNSVANQAFSAVTGTSIGDQIGSYLNAQTGAGLTGRDKALMQWQENLANTSHQREAADLEAAGYNPALTAGGSSGATTPSSPSASSAATMSELAALATLPAQLKLLNAQTRKTEVEADHTAADIGRIEVDMHKGLAQAMEIFQNTERMKFDLQFLKDTRVLDIRAKELANNLSEAQFNQIYQLIDESIEKVNLMIEQEQTEEQKRVLMSAQAILSRAQAWQIAELVPFQQNLMTAQTVEARDSAALAMAHCCWQNGLIDRGVLDDIASQYHYGSDSAKAKASTDDLQAALRNPAYHSKSVTDNEACRQIFSSLYMISDLVRGVGIVVSNKTDNSTHTHHQSDYHEKSWYKY